MARLTVVIDDETLRRARIRALEVGTSVNAMVREHLAEFASGDDRPRAAVRRIVAIADEHAGGGDAPGRGWTRDEIDEERLGRWSR